MLLKKEETRAVYLVQRKIMPHCYKVYLEFKKRHENGKYEYAYSTCLKDDIYYATEDAAREAVKVLGNVYVKKLDWDTIKEPRARSLIYFLSTLVK